MSRPGPGSGDAAAPAAPGAPTPPTAAVDAGGDLEGATIDPTAPRPAAAPQPRPGDHIGRYLLGERLGRGGAGTVYRAYDSLHHREVALKLLPRRDGNEDPAREVFLATHLLDHPHVARVYDEFEHQELQVVAMELLLGGTLRRLIPSPWPRAAEITAAIADGLDHAHRFGFVHRDLKPENVLLDEEGVPHVTDFGLARWSALARDDTLPYSGLMGTPAYLAPEQARGEPPQPAVDQYSLGCLLYELLAGRPPFLGASALAIIRQHLHGTPRPLRALGVELPPALDALVLRLLARLPDARFPAMAEVCRALLALLGEGSNLPGLDPGRRLPLVCAPGDAGEPPALTSAYRSEDWIRAGDHALARDDHELAIACWERALRELERQPDRRSERQALLERLGDLHVLRGERARALAAYHSALHAADAAGAPGRLYRKLAMVRLQEGDHPGALAALDEAEARARAAGPDLHEQAALELARGYVALQQGLTAETITRARRVRRLAARLPDPLARATAANLLCGAYLYRGELASARRWSRRALQEQRASGDLPGLTMALNDAAIVAPDHARAATYYQEALAVAQRSGDRWTEAVLLNNLGDELDLDGRLGEAEATYREVLALAQRIDSAYLAAHAAGNLSSLLRRGGRLDEAERLLAEAEESAQAGDARALQAWLTVERGYLLLARGRAPEALRRFATAARSAGKLAEAEDTIRAELGLAEAWLALGQPRRALAAAGAAAHLAHVGADRRLVRETTRTLTRAWRALGDGSVPGPGAEAARRAGARRGTGSIDPTAAGG